jgi:hypothetical protein
MNDKLNSICILLIFVLLFVTFTSKLYIKGNIELLAGFVGVCSDEK